MFYKLLLCISFIIISTSIQASEFVGSVKCLSCHDTEFQEWSKSDHAKSMAEVSKENVLGSFSNTKITFHNIDSYFYTKKKNEKLEYFVKTIAQSGEEKEFKIKYTFGYSPLQQYLIELDGGHIQALSIAWDSRKKSAGGQRWFHLQPDEDINVEHPFFWTRHFQNWNNRCASCHSTNVDKNYNPKKHTYNTTFSEVNVACESCHGPASNHIKLASNNKLTKSESGFEKPLPEKMQWQLSKEHPIAKAIGETTLQEINMCGRCHSLRTPLQKHEHKQEFLDTNILQSLNSPHYFEDGQIREEVFVLGSFMQSKMFQKGVSCSNCHNPHNGKVVQEGNKLCTQCHAPQVYDSKNHHKHSSENQGSQCVNCHMPERTYMGVDKRRDHSFTIPRPQLSIDLDVPNACITCHGDKNNSWALAALKNWKINPDSEGHWAYAQQEAENGNVLATRQLVKYIEDETLPEFIRASLLSNLSSMPSRVSVETAKKQLLSDNAQIKRAAINSLQNLPAQTRWNMLSPHLDDENKVVRFQLAETLADLITVLPSNQLDRLNTLVYEYRVSLALSLDSPAARLNLANLEIRLGNLQSAELELQQALKIEPNYVPAIINMAEFYRMSGRDNEVEPLLQRALTVAPDSGASNHSYGLLLIRNKNYEAALPYLKSATEKDDATPRFSYVYAIALDNQNQAVKAVDVLTTANAKWTYQYDLLMLQINLLDKLGRRNEVFLYLSKLTAIASGSPAVKSMVKKYSQ